MSVTDTFDYPRHRILQQWAEIASEQDSDEEFQLGNQDIGDQLRKQIDQFIQDPNEERFENAWDDNLYAAKMKGRGASVLNRWDGTLEELATLLEEIRDAEEFDPEWEERIPAGYSFWEFFGRLHIDEFPLINSSTVSGLKFFYPDATINGYLDAKAIIDEFREVYEDIVGHATAGTDHEVPIYFEIDQLFNVIDKSDFDSIADTTDRDCESLYRMVVARKLSTDELEAEFEEVDALVERYISERRSGKHEFEDWKWDYGEHFESEIEDRFTLTDLSPADTEPLMEALSKSPRDLPDADDDWNTVVPIHLLGAGAGGGEAWDAFTDQSISEPEEAAEVLSTLFDEGAHITVRLEEFKAFYDGDDVEASTGQLLCIASLLLMYAYPEEYVCYKYSEMKEFFAERDSYHVRRGFDASQYWLINEACRSLLTNIASRVENGSMLDVHTLIWLYKNFEGEPPIDLGGASVWYMNPDDEWEACRSVGVTTIGWPEVIEMELNEVSKSDIGDQFDDSGSTKPTALYNFGHELAEGAILVAKTKTDQVYGMGVVTGDYYRDRELQQERFEDASDCHFRDVEWFIDFVEILGETYTIDWSEFDRGQFQSSTGVREFTDAYLTLRQQVLEQIAGDDDLELRSKFEELERLSDALTRRRSPDDESDYYWVNQNSNAEIENEYLQAPVDPDMWAQDLTRPKTGDVVIHKHGDELTAHSTVLAAATEVELDDGSHHRVPVYMEWFDEPRNVDQAVQYLRQDRIRGDSEKYPLDKNGDLIEGYLFNLPREAGRQLLDGIPTPSTYTEYSEELAIFGDDHDINIDGLYFPDEGSILQRVTTALQNGNHVLLVGPPGTGKTKLAKQICRGFVDDSFELVTATSDWSTFDTIGGYHPEEGDELVFKPGLFLERFQDEDDGTPTNEWLIVDEINRADIDKAFGSLFSALTGESVTLPFSDEADRDIRILGDDADADVEVATNLYHVPDDWRMIATMNTLDKTSLYEMSYAFMRRWAFVPVSIPDISETSDDDDGGTNGENHVAEYVDRWVENDTHLEKDEEKYGKLAAIWRTINQYREIGPAIVEDIYRYVQGQEEATADYVSPIVMHVFPQLEGLREQELETFVSDLEAVLDLEGENTELRAFAEDYFQIEIAESE